MDLLTNAVESIQVGVEDYNLATRPRLVSAVRNIHAGILLLYKEALRRESPQSSNDVLVMARISPSRNAKGDVIFVGEGTKTANVQQIRDRFEALGIATDWKRFERVTKARNEVEHFYPELDQKGLSGLISNSFLIIRDFIAEQLEDDPRELLGEGAWQTMLGLSEVHEKEKQECERLLAQLEWTSPFLEEGISALTCGVCGSDLLKPTKNEFEEIILQCSSCGDSERPESYAPKAIESALGFEKYRAFKDGGETPYVSCPECGEETYVIEEQKCALCDFRAEHTCMRCGMEIPAEELESSPLCGYCEHMSNKDD